MSYYAKKFLDAVGDEFELPYPDVFEEAFYILAKRVSPETLIELTKQISELED